jgi:hypothetical protein
VPCKSSNNKIPRKEEIFTKDFPFNISSKLALKVNEVDRNGGGGVSAAFTQNLNSISKADLKPSHTFCAKSLVMKLRHD